VTYLLDANTLACALNDTGGVRARVNDAEATARILHQRRRRSRAQLWRVGVGPQVRRPKGESAQAGPRKGDADLQIAATAIVEDAVLVTDDRALLDGMIPDLKADNWIER